MPVAFMEFDPACDHLAALPPFETLDLQVYDGKPGYAHTIEAMPSGRAAVFPLSGQFQLVAQDGSSIHDVVCTPGHAVLVAPMTWIDLCRFTAGTKFAVARSANGKKGDRVTRQEFELLIGKRVARIVPD